MEEKMHLVAMAALVGVATGLIACWVSEGPAGNWGGISTIVGGVVIWLAGDLLIKRRRRH